MGKKSPEGVPQQLVSGDHGKTDEDAGREAEIEGEDVDILCGAPALAICGFELRSFIFSETVRRKRLEGQTLSEGAVDTARLPQYEFSNLQNLPLTFLLDFLCWPVIEFY